MSFQGTWRLVVVFGMIILTVDDVMPSPHISHVTCTTPATKYVTVTVMQTMTQLLLRPDDPADFTRGFGRNLISHTSLLQLDHGYLPPAPLEHGYLPPPGQGYLPPGQDYLSPTHGYLPPAGYLPPNQGRLLSSPDNQPSHIVLLASQSALSPSYGYRPTRTPSIITITPTSSSFQQATAANIITFPCRCGTCEIAMSEHPCKCVPVFGCHGRFEVRGPKVEGGKGRAYESDGLE